MTKKEINYLKLALYHFREFELIKRYEKASNGIIKKDFSKLAKEHLSAYLLYTQKAH